ncbi:uncharacterized protein LOC129590692 [Paramacrobiotus metropolitanus]|uniref:uncharacterized protein LOC129590692 n=1 Tax=Paramacrobiotus metropolitanus TaxID=2943436 RepID=UPI002445FCF3|nr:uncharacterized protein LOC129590692 [Paramacrobiotus metropolitanus]
MGTIILRICLVLGAFFPSTESSALPHPQCFFPEHQPFDLACTQADLHFPGNFNACALPTVYGALFTLVLDCPTSNFNTYCNTLGKYFQALPRNDGIWRVTLKGFRSETEARAPIDRLLSNLHSVLILIIQYSKIGRLDAAFLSGFPSLLTLDIEKNDIKDIAIDTFRSVPILSYLILSFLQLSENSLTYFDWTTLEPVANHLLFLELRQQTPPLRHLYRSGPRFNVHLSTLSLDGNLLPSISKDVLDTLIVKEDRVNVKFNFRHNPICPEDDDCGCWAMENFHQWFNSTVHSPGLLTDKYLEVKVTCGPAWSIPGNPEKVYRADSQSLCIAW